MKKLIFILALILSPLILLGQHKYLKDVTVTGTISMGTLTTPYTDAIVVAKSGGDYVTIQEALAVCTGGEVILLYPGTYTETITFADDNVSIIVIGRPENTTITQADANVVNFASTNGCSITGATISLTAPTDATKDAITMTGASSAEIRFCNLYLETASAIAGVDQPHIVNLAGTSKLSIRRGNAIYRHTGATTDGIKTPFYCQAGTSLELFKVSNIDIDNSGSAAITAIFAHATTGTILMVKCIADVDDDDATAVAGFGYLTGSATDIEFHYSDVHVHGNTNAAYGIYVGNPTVRMMFNHISVETAGVGAENGLFEGGSGKITSQFDDIVAGTPVTGNVIYANSLADGDLNLSGTLNISSLATASTEVLSPDATGNTIARETADASAITFSTLTAGTITATGNISGTTDITLDTDATIVLATTDCRNKVRFNNDADVIDYTLPGAEAGLVVVFYDIGGGVITIDPVDGTDTIYLNGTSVGAGDAIDSPGVVGDFICLMAVDDTRWVTIGRSGVWEDGGTD